MPSDVRILGLQVAWHKIATKSAHAQNSIQNPLQISRMRRFRRDFCAKQPAILCTEISICMTSVWLATLANYFGVPFLSSIFQVQ